MIKDASAYFVDGCGRCDHFATDLCKARKWSEPLQLLREILLDSGLNEEVKWGQPTYTLKGKNVAMLFAFKDTCGITTPAKPARYTERSEHIVIFFSS